MDEDIVCRKCDSPSCKGCNLKNLEIMLNNGKFDCLMNENHCINPSDDIAPVRHGQWIDGDQYCPICGKDKFRGLDADIWSDWKPDFCPNCGAKMDGEV